MEAHQHDPLTFFKLLSHRIPMIPIGPCYDPHSFVISEGYGEVPYRVKVTHSVDQHVSFDQAHAEKGIEGAHISLR